MVLGSLVVLNKRPSLEYRREEDHEKSKRLEQHLEERMRVETSA
jgi:hypothetical protein